MRDIYYSADPLAIQSHDGVIVIMEDDQGLEPTGPVVWHNSDDTVGVLETDEYTPDSRRHFIPQATGAPIARETIVSAEFDGQIASTKVIVFPSRRVTIKDDRSKGLDFDGDGINDFVVNPGDNRAKFPFGGYIVDFEHIFPYNLGDMDPENYETPAVAEAFLATNDHWACGVFNTSSGKKYACLFGGGITSEGYATQSIIWRPL